MQKVIARRHSEMSAVGDIVCLYGHRKGVLERGVSQRLEGFAMRSGDIRDGAPHALIAPRLEASAA